MIGERTGGLEARARPRRPARARRLPRVRARDRAARREGVGARSLGRSTLPDAPIGELPDFDEQVKLMFDLIALAYQANLTRVASYIMVAEGTNRTYNHIGVSGRVPPAVAPREQQGPHRQAREDPDVPRGALRGLRREAREDARRRRLAARSLAVPVRLEHEQQRPAQQLSAAEHPGRRRERRAEGRPAPRRCPSTRRSRTCTSPSSTRPGSR